MYEYEPRFRGGVASGEIIRHGRQLGGKRAVPPETRPRTDVDDNDCRQDSATNEHEIMNKFGRATGPSANGLFVKYDMIHRYGGTDVSEAPNTYDGNNVALRLRGGGRGRQPARARGKVCRPCFDRSRARGRRGGQQAAAAEEQPELRDRIARDTVTDGNRPALEDEAQAADRRTAPHVPPSSYPLPLAPPGPSSNAATVPRRVPNPNFNPAPPLRLDDNVEAVPRLVPNPNLDPALFIQQDLILPPLQPLWPDSNLAPSLPAWQNLNAPSAQIGTHSPPSPYSDFLLRGRFPDSHGFWNHHFPWSFLRYAVLSRSELDFWQAWQQYSPTGVPPAWLVLLTTELAQRGDNPLGLSEASAWALRAWVQRSEASQDGQRQPILDQVPREGLPASPPVKEEPDSA